MISGEKAQSYSDNNRKNLFKIQNIRKSNKLTKFIIKFETESTTSDFVHFLPQNNKERKRTREFKRGKMQGKRTQLPELKSWFARHSTN